MIFLYQLLVSLAVVAALPVLPLIMAVSKKRRHGLLHRLGLMSFLALPDMSEKRRRIWVHALSVGEVRSAQPLMESLAKNPGVEVVFTASTMTGLAMAQDLYQGEERSLALGVGYFPFDFWWAVSAVFRRIQPNEICLVETDIWPWFIKYASGKGVRVSLINARMSKRSFAGYQKLGPLKGSYFTHLGQVLAQTPLDRERFQAIGVPGSRIHVTGNMKFDQPVPVLDAPAMATLRQSLGADAGQPMLLAGSTHPGEEEILFRAWAKVMAVCPLAKLVLAPRDIDRSREICLLVKKHGWSVFCHSEGPRRTPTTADTVTLIDGYGILAQAYAVCDLAFIGGTLIASGGHNPLEAARFEKPVLFGPHMDDFLEPAELLTRSGAAFIIENESDLAEQIIQLFQHEQKAKEMGRAGARVYLANQGALDRIMGRILHVPT